MATSNPFAGLALRNPEFAHDDAVAIAQEHFGVGGTPRELGSQQDQNVLLDDGGSRTILKIANPGFGRDSLVLQNAAMHHLAAKALALETPVPLPARDGREIVPVERAGETFDVRLVTWIDGEPVADQHHLPDALLEGIGAAAATMAVGLAGFDHPAAERVLQWDLQHAADVVSALVGEVRNPAQRAQVERAAERFGAVLDRLGPALRRGVIHGDVTEWNVVARRDVSGRLVPCGVIDFGDVVRSWLAGEAAVAACTALHTDPRRAVQGVAALLRGFHGVLPLTEDEIEAMHALVLARAAVCAVSSESQAQLAPDNAYVQEMLAGEWGLLDAAEAMPEAVASTAWRAACGFERLPRSVARATFPAGGPLADGLDGRALVPLDLSPLGDDLRFDEPHRPRGAARAVDEAETRGVPVGRHGEPRLTATPRPSADEPATIALGADLFLPAGTSVLAPLAGTVERAGADGLVLRLKAGGWLALGGLAPAPAVGARVAQGDRLGAVLEPPADDPLPARIHVQPLLVLPDGAVPGLVEPSLADAWLALSPDPSPLLGADVTAPPLPDDDAAREQRLAHVAAAQILYYQRPPQIVRGLRQWLYGADARSYLDAVNNVAVLGHSHPGVAEAAARQLRILNTNSRFLYPSITRYAERLAALLPEGLDTVFLVSSGSEANDLALRISREVTGHADVLAIRGAYHGWTVATHAISTAPYDNPHANERLPDWVHPVEQPNVFRGAHRGEDAGARYADDVRDRLRALADAGRGPAAFLCEPLLGNSGGVELPDGYLAQVYDAVRAAGGLTIADEVQVGMGRLGERFWAFEREDVVPDIVTLAKPAGNGQPLGAVVTTRAIADRFGRDASWFSSMGGAPISCEVGLAVLDAIEGERLQANALAVGTHLRERLRELVERHELAGAAHGVGLYLGLELVRDRDTLEPAAEEAEALCERVRERGAIVQPTGDHMNVLKIKPPLCLTRADADFLADRIDEALGNGW